MSRKPTYEELERQITALERQVAVNKATEKELWTRIKSLESNTGADKIRVSNIGIEWDMENGTCTFEKLPVAMMWVDSTLAGLMSGVQAMVGTKRFNLALQSEGRKSVEADWQVISQYSNFEEGFKAIANIAAVAGWGDWRLISLDEDKKRCHFRVMDNWEGRYQKALGVCWGSGMLAGKLAGYCSKLFETNCWAEQTKFIAKGDKYDEFKVKPSELSIETEIEKLLAADEATAADMAVALQKLEIEIADRKRTEEALRESEQKLIDAQKMGKMGHWEFDLETQQTTWSDMIYEFYERDPSQGPYDYPESLALYSPEDSKRIQKEVLRAIETGENIKMDYRVIHPSGRVAYYSSTFHPIKDQTGRTTKVRGTAQDITERKRAEEIMIQSEKMMSVGGLAAGMAHEINNPLAGILQNAQNALRRLTEDSLINERAAADHGMSMSAVKGFMETREIIRMLEAIRESGQRAAAIVENMLGFSRKSVSSFSFYDVHELLDKTVDLASTDYDLKKKYDFRQIDISREYDSTIPQVYCEGPKIQQVILNLLRNAAQSFSSQSDRTVPPKICLRSKKEGQMVRIEVEDNGAGMTDEIRKRAFEPFFTTKEVGVGTGLGLSVSYFIITENHKGSMTVDSVPGKGTKFIILLPIK